MALSLFGSDEQRELARRLLPNTPEERDSPHPYFAAQFEPGSQAERDYLESPSVKIIEGLVNSQEVELGGDDWVALTDLTNKVPDKVPLLPLSLGPRSLEVPEEPIGESLKKLIPDPNPVTRKPPGPKFVFPSSQPPLPEQDFGKPPLDW